MTLNTQTSNEMWQQCLAHLKTQTTEEEFSKWFEPIVPLEFDGTTLRLRVPNASYVYQIEKNYLKFLRPIISQLYGLQTKLFYAVPKPAPAPQPEVDTTEIRRAIVQNDTANIQNPLTIPGLRRLKIDPNLSPGLRFSNYIEGDCNRLARSAGMAIAIVRDDLLGHAADTVPTMMNYTTLLAKDSMYNTPPCWCIYMTGLVLKYLENDIGGLAKMQEINEAKAKVLYDYLDGQDFFKNPVEHRYRSTMNVTFTSPDPDLDKKFCAEAADAGFVNLKGHRLVGGMRASIYNAMPKEGVEALVDFLKKYEAEHT